MYGTDVLIGFTMKIVRIVATHTDFLCAFFGDIYSAVVVE